LSVWFVIPSKRPLAEANRCLEAWRDMGYCTAVMREAKDEVTTASAQFDVYDYQGWARSVNILVGAIMAKEPGAQWFVTGGDDYFPDPHKRADEIAAECEDYFARYNAGPDAAAGVNLSVKSIIAALEGLAARTFGVMQPTGDRWGERAGQSAVIDRICGSPWMGREFCRRMYHGGGPLYPGYYHNFADEELQNVAQMLGVLWQRRDLTQEHRHWARPGVVSKHGGDVRDMPEWAAKINDPVKSDWERSKALFAKRKAAGFPGHEPLEF
jgi:hypothetical protein